MAWLTERASNLDPDPSGVDAIGAEDEAAGENDGSGGVDWGYWQGVNPDIIGWVTVPGAGIDYPIVQAHEGDPDHYLRYDVYGGWNYHGVPYLHWKCADDGLLGAGQRPGVRPPSQRRHDVLRVGVFLGRRLRGGAFPDHPADPRGRRRAEGAWRSTLSMPAARAPRLSSPTTPSMRNGLPGSWPTPT